VANTVKTTLGELVTAEPALNRLLEAKLPVKVAYHVAKVARLMKQETAYFNKEREALIRELGEETMIDGQQAIQVSPAKTAEFSRRLTEIASIEVSLDVRPIALNDVTVEISGADVLALGPLLEAA
jgi:hypothetical protein